MLFPDPSPAGLLPYPGRKKEDSSLGNLIYPKETKSIDLTSGGPDLMILHDAHQKNSFERAHGAPMNRQLKTTRALREVYLQKTKTKHGMVAHACNPSTLGS